VGDSKAVALQGAAGSRDVTESPSRFHPVADGAEPFTDALRNFPIRHQLLALHMPVRFDECPEDFA
jgi:hypothetical protein